MRKKGTEKPIEIFVALFIILAVAMLLLKMMRDQTAGSEKQLKDAQRQQAMQDFTQAAQKTCDDLCSQARDTGCPLKAMARFCLAKYRASYLGIEQAGYDINKNFEFDEKWVDDVGFAVCETNVFCSQMTMPPCACKGGLTMEKCLPVLCEYYKSIGIDGTKQIASNFVFGDCAKPDPLSDGIDTWLGHMTAIGLNKCPP